MKRLVSLLLAVIMVMSVFAIIPVTANAADTTTVYFQNNWMWTDVNVYYWFNGGAQNNAQWPGQPAQKFGNDGTYDIYSVTLPAGVEGVIFNGFDGGINALNQTPDIKGFAEGNCYSMVWNNANGVSVQDINDVIKVDPTYPPIPTNPPETQPEETTVKPTEDDVNGLFVKVDGKEYAVEKGETYTYQFIISVPDVKISGIDVLTTYDTAGLDLVPYMDGNEVDNAKHFPALPDVVSNVTDYDGEVYYNFSNYKGIALNDAVIFQGQFKVTADKGVFDINSKIKTMIDTDITRYVYNFEILKNFTQTQKFNEGNNPIEPTEDKPEPGKIFVNLDGTKYEVAQGDVITYRYTLNVPDVRVSSFDANTFYDTDGLDLIPFLTDGEVDDVKHFPALPSVISNVTDIDGEVYYNLANHKGIKLENAVVFTAQFKVTATSGTYDITTRILTMADTAMNALVYEYEKLGNFTEKFELVDYVEPSTTVKPTTPKPTQSEDDGLFVNVDGKKYAVSKGDVITYQYVLNVPGVKISSFDANTVFDTTGLELIPFTNGGEIDDTKHFPAFKTVISNFEHKGEVYYNYANYKGVELSNAVIFTAQFKVTASSGTYDITTRIFTMADTDMNALVYDYEKKGNFTEESKLVDYTEPETKPTEPQKPTTNPTGDLYLNVDGTKYAVEQGQTYTYQFKVTVPGSKVASFDAQTFYDTDGIDVVPFMDGEYIDEAKHFPAFASSISNFDIDGEIYYNYSNHKGITLNDSVVFVCQFKVTASSGTYDITTRIKTMADPALNKIVYNFEKISEFSQESELVGYVKPTDGPTNPGEHNLFLNVDGRKYAVEQGQIYTYQYTLNVPGGVKISSFDANTFYDTDGMDLIPYMDGEYVDDTRHFPSFASVISNVTDIDGEVYYNYANHKGVKLENAVIFTAQFKVTASSGTYDITTRILTMADTAMNALVYDYEKLGEFTEKSELVGYVEPSTENPGRLLGDVNLDGYINIFDATEIQCHIAEIDTLTAEQLAVADVNFDGYVNVFDATRIQLLVAGYITEFA